ncbi:hypothetical protein K435DRAFT_721142 [Dendrothele bispora CBS 962.96]|uniref:Protein kinase domain-containing protein n=1 Tax=Dendrothele bispora (strain CBS 962.96) TaxID=1314807 RepID=A0A4V4HGA9_DENBC|nr:hypothetical protein K435DRAFT_721142 [Dendrothele bispora CBS 962.96]
MFQHRNHFFTVFIRGVTARLIRWDRAGAIVTEEFDYGQEPYLADFYWRFTHATAKARGHDTTVRRLSETGEDRDLVVLVRKKLGLKLKEPVFEINVWNDAPVATEGLPYYGSKPFVNHAQSVTGRATRVFRVWDDRMKKIVALKDCWRVNSSSILPEGQVYAVLKENDVRNIPTCLRAGDVDPGCAYQRTQTQDVSPSARTVRSHIHYRIVLKEVCVGNITDFKDTKELVSVLRDAMIAHTDAYTKAGLLHRDVSAGNILITEDRRGLLGDWELSKLVADLSTARQPQRTGTWQFISAALLRPDRPCHSLEDDLESFVHVFSWTCLKHVKNTMMPSELGDHLFLGYDQVIFDRTTDQVFGGKTKERNLKSRALRTAGFVDSAFRDLLLDFEDTCAARYDPDPDPSIVAQSRAALASTTDPFIRDTVLSRLPDLVTQNKRDRLESGQWFIDRCDEAMNSGYWPSFPQARVVNDYDRKEMISSTIYPSTNDSTQSGVNRPVKISNHESEVQSESESKSESKSFSHGKGLRRSPRLMAASVSGSGQTGTRSSSMLESVPEDDYAL